ncbi:BAR-domain-containing protein [Xylaria bambusicola]|uniref:BAR-domain-containing protein n=1 Tax=Xylaria bambusicola TaxID=326684 RepID=UPI00200729A2|nr:BAR-domain-containing protein [Xylaria bambusicola]KAI0517428.1 BAR-domain-containing protein [Xylaria bambusicola]
MVFTKKIDRAFQWAGEKMGHEAKITHSDDFKMLETEMSLRYDGMDRLQKSMNVYIKSLSRRGETFEDKEKGLPVSYLGRTMIAHGEEFEPDSEYGNNLIAMGRANERIAGLQETYVSHATSYWLEGLERSLAMMKEYQSARKKLENRRLTYESCATKIQKAKREDFRLEDELRTSKAKYEESSEDVYRRMMDIKEAEADSVRDLGNFLDSELDYYERCAEELRRVKQDWMGSQTQSPAGSRASDFGSVRRPTNRQRGDVIRSHSEVDDRAEQWAGRQDIYNREPTPEAVRMPIRSNRSASGGSATHEVVRPTINRSVTYREPPQPPVPEISVRPTQTMPPNVGSLRSNLRPVSRIQTTQNLSPDCFGDDYDTATSSGSPDYDRSDSPATSYGSLSRTTSNTALRPTPAPTTAKKAPPPPPPSRSKKPPPPIPAKRDVSYHT